MAEFNTLFARGEVKKKSDCPFLYCLIVIRIMIIIITIIIIKTSNVIKLLKKCRKRAKLTQMKTDIILPEDPLADW